MGWLIFSLGVPTLHKLGCSVARDGSLGRKEKIFWNKESFSAKGIFNASCRETLFSKLNALWNMPMVHKQNSGTISDKNKEL